MNLQVGTSHQIWAGLRRSKNPSQSFNIKRRSFGNKGLELYGFLLRIRTQSSFTSEQAIDDAKIISTVCMIGREFGKRMRVEWPL